MKISGVVITQNEEDRLGACLESMSFCDEIVVVDGGSTDGTVELAKRHTGNVHFRQWDNYRDQKIHAVSLAKSPWVLLLDSDERATPELVAEIKSLPDDPPENGFSIPRDLYFMGRRMKYGGAGDRVTRLFRKSAFSMADASIHEHIVIEPPVGKLKSPIEHFSYRDLTDYFQRFNRYTSLMAKERFDKGVRAGFAQNFRFVYEFIARYFVKCGFWDGYPGFVYAAISSFYAWTKYAKLRELTDYKRDDK